MYTCMELAPVAAWRGGGGGGGASPCHNFLYACASLRGLATVAIALQNIAECKP